METSTRHESVEPEVTDRVVLTIPGKADFHVVATLVLGGVGSRLDLPYERMDDLQLAVLSMLDVAADDRVTIEFEATEDEVAVSVGPLVPERASDEGLTLVLSKLADRVGRHSRDDGEWLTLGLARPQRATG